MNGTNSRFVSTYSKAKPIAIMNSNGPAVQRVVEERLRHAEVPHAVVHVREVAIPSKNLL